MAGVKGTKHGYSGPRWTAAEYERLACAMVAMIAKGKSKLQALTAAQRMLPKSRQRDPKRLKPNLRGIMETALAKALGMSEPDRAAIVAVMTDIKAVADGASGIAKEPVPSLPVAGEPIARGKNHHVRWSNVEWALVARRVAYFQRDLQDKRVLSRLIKVAQKIELPPASRRGEHAIDTSMAKNRESLANAYAEHDKLLANRPFDAARTEYVGPTVDEAAPAPNLAFPGVNIDGPRKSPPIASEPVQAPTLAPIPPQPVSEPIRAFGELFAQGMSDLIRSMTQTMMGELEVRVGQMSERLMARAIETMGQGVAGMVHSALEKELGPIAPSGPQGEAFELPPGASLPELLSLDVVGLNGSLASEVKQALNGYGAHIRFIEQDKIDSWTPQRNRPVILNTKFSSHSVERKCSHRGIKPIRIQGGSGAILNAIRELYAKEGITLATH